jgi:hypothetical protein
MHLAVLVEDKERSISSADLNGFSIVHLPKQVGDPCFVPAYLGIASLPWARLSMRLWEMRLRPSFANK